MAMQCPKCRTSNLDSARFCQSCGTAIRQAGPASPVAVQTVIRPLVGTKTQILPGVLPASGRGGTRIMPPASQQREITFVVLDRSPSMDEPYDSSFTKLEAASRAFSSMYLQKARIDDQDEYGLVAFNHEAQLLCELNPIATHKTEFLRALQDIETSGSTDINTGLTLARDRFQWERPDVVRRITLLTDGLGGHPLDTAEDLKGRGVVIEVIGVGNEPTDVDEKLLRKVASVINGETRYFFLKDRRSLVRTATSLGRKTQLSA